MTATSLALQTVGNYDLEASLGTGSFGQVFRAHHVRSQQAAAVKVLDASVALGGDFPERFVRLMTRLAGLRSAHLVPILDYGVDAGRCYQATMLFDTSLATMIQRDADHVLPLATCVALVYQAATALQVAHSNGIVHGDIKPANMLLAQADGPVGYSLAVADLGLATLAVSDPEDTGAQVFGNPAYVSPEQSRGEAPDVRSDIYSLGVVLYELITGYLPFSASEPVAWLTSNAAKPPLPSKQRPDIPAHLDSVALRCLERNRAERFSSAAELAAALHGILSTMLPDLVLAPPDAGTAAPAGSGIETNALQSATHRPQIHVLDQHGYSLIMVPVSGEGLSIGRLPDNDLHLDAQAVADYHAQVDWDGTSVSIVDLGSATGTVFNNQRLQPQDEQRWPWGRQIQLGPYTLVLADELMPQTVPPAATTSQHPSAIDQPAAVAETPPVTREIVAEVQPQQPPQPTSEVAAVAAPVTPEAPAAEAPAQQAATRNMFDMVAWAHNGFRSGQTLFWRARSLLYRLQHPTLNSGDVDRGMDMIKRSQPPPSAAAVPRQQTSSVSSPVANGATVAATALPGLAAQNGAPAPHTLPATVPALTSSGQRTALTRQGLVTDIPLSVVPGIDPARTGQQPGVSSRIRIVLDSDTLVITPGQPTTFPLTLTNHKSKTDHFTIKVHYYDADGALVPTTWVQDIGTPIQLNPWSSQQDSRTITLPVTVRRAPENKAGTYRVQIRAYSHESQNEYGEAIATWTVLPFAESTMTLRPRRVAARRRARIMVGMDNNGNTPATYRFTGTDESEQLDYRFVDQDAFRAQPGESLKTPLRVYAPIHWLGSTRSHAVTVHGKADQDATPYTGTVQFMQKALIPAWLLPLLLLLAVSLFLWTFGIIPIALASPLRAIPWYCVFCAKPTLTNNTLRIKDGQTRAITSSDLLLVMQGTEPKNLLYRIIAPPTNGTLLKEGKPVSTSDYFSQDDIANKRISFTTALTATQTGAATALYQTMALGSSSVVSQSTDIVSIRYTDNRVNPIGGEFTIMIEPWSKAFLDKNSLFVNGDRVSVTGQDLHVTTRAASSDIRYTLSSIPGFGELQFNGSKLDVGKTFTQQDIDNGALIYVQDPKNTSENDKFGFDFDDSILPAIPGSLSITIDRPLGAQQQETPAPVTVVETAAPTEAPTPIPQPTAVPPTPTPQPTPTSGPTPIPSGCRIKDIVVPGGVESFLVYIGKVEGTRIVSERVITGGTSKTAHLVPIPFNEATGQYRLTVRDRNSRQVIGRYSVDVRYNAKTQTRTQVICPLPDTTP